MTSIFPGNATDFGFGYCKWKRRYKQGEQCLNWLSEWCPNSKHDSPHLNHKSFRDQTLTSCSGDFDSLTDVLELKIQTIYSVFLWELIRNNQLQLPSVSCHIYQTVLSRLSWETIMIPFVYDSHSKCLSSTCQQLIRYTENPTHISPLISPVSQPFSSHSLKCSHPHTPPHSTHTMTYSRHFLLHSSKMGSVSIAAWLPSSCCFVSEIGAVWIQVT